MFQVAQKSPKMNTNLFQILETLCLQKQTKKKKQRAQQNMEELRRKEQIY